jgi:hypothetical protein
MAMRERPWLNSFGKMLQEEYGIDFRQGMHSVTLFSDTYQAHTGSILLHADFDRSKVEAKLKAQPKVEVSQWRDHTIYVCANKYADGDAQEKQMAVLLLEENKVLFCSSLERLQTTAKLFSGEAPSLKQSTSPLIANVDQGAVVYGAAMNLDEIAKREETFPILEQHERIVYVVGEKAGKVYENVTLVAQSEDVAKEMKSALDGLVAFMRVWAGSSKELRAVLEDVEVQRDGKTVTSRFEGSTEEVMFALKAFRDRLMPETTKVELRETID